MRTQQCAAVVLVVCFGLASTASAQERRGLWFEFDVGAGSVGVSAGNFDDSRGPAGIAGLGLGWALTPRVLLGVDYRVTAFDVRGPLIGTVYVSNVGARVSYYPFPSHGFFVKGLLGGSSVDLEAEQSGTTLTDNVGKGVELGAGAGYDWYLGRGLSLTPSVTYWSGRSGDFRFLGQTFFTDWGQNVIDVTIGVSFH
jgi:hypothetical protein